MPRPAPGQGGGGLVLIADQKKRSSTSSSRTKKSPSRATSKTGRATSKTSRATTSRSSGNADTGTTAAGPSGAWKAERKGQGKNKICYIVSFPHKKQGKYTRRDATYLVVAHRPAERVFDEVSVEAGYNYKPASVVTAQVDGKTTFKLFTKGGNAWPTDAAADKALVTAMKKGRSLVLKGTSTRGTATTDTYSLSGFTRALAKIDRDCPG